MRADDYYTKKARELASAIAGEAQFSNEIIRLCLDALKEIYDNGYEDGYADGEEAHSS